MDSKKLHLEYRYVAFCDLLGFSKAVLSDFEKVLDVYCEFENEMKVLKKIFTDVGIFSDAVIISSTKLGEVASAVQLLYFVCLKNGFLMRGGIGYGKHWKNMSKNDVFVVSEALTRAVNIEKDKSNWEPVVIVDDEINLNFENYWSSLFFQTVFDTSIIHYKGKNIINPFSNYCFNTGIFHIKNLKSNISSSKIKAKYNYLLGLSRAIKRRESFVPKEIVDELVLKGVIEEQ